MENTIELFTLTICVREIKITPMQTALDPSQQQSKSADGLRSNLFGTQPIIPNQNKQIF